MLGRSPHAGKAERGERGGIVNRGGGCDVQEMVICI